jgi:tetratricopeptide (TPR) repeat protein
LQLLRRRKTRAHLLAERARDARNWPLAVQHYRRAVRRRPRNAALWVQFGHVLKESGNLAGAERAYRRSIEIDGRPPDSHLQLGHVLKMQGRRDEAAAAYLRAFAVDPAPTHAALELYGMCWRPVDALDPAWGENLMVFLNAIASLPGLAHEQQRLAREVEQLRREVDRLQHRPSPGEPAVVAAIE